MKNKISLFFLFFTFTAVIPETAFASSSIGEFTRPLESILELLSGPVVRIIGTISIVICGIMLAFQWESMDNSMRKIIFIVIALSLVMCANKFIASWFGFSGALI